MENKWIPCSERLPEPHIVVIVSSMNGVMEGYLMDNRTEFKLCRYSIKENIDNVFAWMPLPRPYEEENNDSYEV